MAQAHAGDMANPFDVGHAGEELVAKFLLTTFRLSVLPSAGRLDGYTPKAPLLYLPDGTKLRAPDLTIAAPFYGPAFIEVKTTSDFRYHGTHGHLIGIHNFPDYYVLPALTGAKTFLALLLYGPRTLYLADVTALKPVWVRDGYPGQTYFRRGDDELEVPVHRFTTREIEQWYALKLARRHAARRTARWGDPPETWA